MEQVDDRDPRIKYSGNWRKAGDSDEYSSTTSGTSSGNASFSFTFNGTYVAVYGTLNNEGTRDSFTIFTLDGANPSIFASQPTDRTVNQTMYSSPELTNGEHTLLVRNLVEQGMIFIDYLQVRPNGSQLEVLPPSDTLNITSSCPTPAPSCPSVPLSPFTATATTTTMTASPTSCSSRSQDLSPSAAAGVGVAGTLLFAACVILVWWFMKDRFSRGTAQRDDHESRNKLTPSPFPLAATKSSLATRGPSSRRYHNGSTDGITSSKS